ncbi:hypothetical protein SAMN05444406_11951 [Caldicoprobacter faecalis]|uniref:Uncharacterized protein n=2 Tax=Caldicoprobacter faecalis TaxID=937334 RepID=A0A1I5WVR5_9FIRM|nr:hypothetical protein SAMN05444406_11951 [Caldicoprobacter faecalis]
MSILQNIIKRKCICYFFIFLCSVLLCTMLSACSTGSTSPNSASYSSTNPSSEMNEQVRKFLREHNLTLADKPGWIPSDILDYSDYTDEMFDNKLKDNIKGYITSIDEDEIGINEVIWISNTNRDSGFEILDPSPDIIRYPLAQDVEVWVLTEMVHIQIPLRDLKSYVEKYEHTLWNIGVEEGKIITLIEQYVP